MTQDEIQKMIDESIASELAFSKKKIGDTPTDALQLVNKKYIDGRIYAGFVNVDGTPGTPFPVGWTSAVSGSPNIDVTHNLGTTAYSVVTTAFYSSNYVVPVITQMNANTFRVNFIGIGGNASAIQAFSFALSTK